MKKTFSPRSNSSSSVALLEEAQSSSGSSSANPCSCEILRDGKKISGKNATALPGDAISLSLKCVGGTPSNIEWSIAAKNFTEYTLDTPKNKLEVFAPDDTKKTPLKTFYWTDSGSKKVSVKCKVAGKDCSADVTINIVKPTCDYSVSSFGEVRQVEYSGNQILRLVSRTTGSPPGIQFTAKVTIPSSFAAGKWCYVQTVNQDLIQKVIGQTKCLVSKYHNETVADGLQPRVEVSTGSEEKEADSPSVAMVDATNGYSHSAPCFATYVMFRPAGGKWVPLKVIKWAVWGCADGATPSSKKGAKKGEPEETTDHPLWNHYITAGELPVELRDCPGDDACASWAPRDCK